MSDSSIPAAVPTSPTAAPAPTEAIAPSPTPRRKRGYYNKSQLEDVRLAEDISEAASQAQHAERLRAAGGLPENFFPVFEEVLTEARSRIGQTAAGQEDTETDTMHATGAERALVVGLQAIQSAAKQKARQAMLLGGKFSTAGYLLGVRLNPSAAGLAQNAATLRAKAAADALPGYDAAGLEKFDTLVGAFETTATAQTAGQEEASLERVGRDALMLRLNAGRLALQHAIDRLHPYSDPASAPIRRTFHLPANRPMPE